MHSALKSMARGMLRRGMLSPLVLSVAPPEGVWLTFDDGPDPATTPGVLQALGQARVRATFFMIGLQMERHPTLVEAVRAQGHTMALHGFEHHPVAELSWRAQWRDLERMRAVAERFGVPLRWYRPSYGELSMPRLVWCALHSVRIVMWSFESRDSFVCDAAALIAYVMSQTLRNGDIALFHDDTPLTVEALPAILAHARSAGLTFTQPQQS